MNNKEWVTHLIDRFGGMNILLYLDRGERCPCFALSMQCRSCRFMTRVIGPVGGMNSLFGCKQSLEWYRMKDKRINKIRRRLKRRVKKWNKKNGLST
jgi:hypothetical protein